MTTENCNELISIVIPVYNTSNELPRCLDSILSNTYTSLELICVNDGSTDNSLDILSDYATKDDRVKVISQENAGVSEARNTGMRYATGDYIAFVDSDDWVHPQYFECLLAALRYKGADVVICESKLVTGIEAYPTIGLNFSALQYLLVSAVKKNYTVRHRVCTHLYRKELIVNHWFPKNVSVGEDTLFNLDVICHKKDLKIVYLGNEIFPPLYYYFDREGSATHSKPVSGIEQVRWFRQHKLDSELELTGNEWLLLEHVIKMALAARYYNDYGEKDKRKKKEINEHLRVLIPKFKTSQYAPVKDKVIIAAMAAYPGLYRAFRLKDDPTLRKWESNQR